MIANQSEYEPLSGEELLALRKKRGSHDLEARVITLTLGGERYAYFHISATFEIDDSVKALVLMFLGLAGSKVLKFDYWDRGITWKENEIIVESSFDRVGSFRWVLPRDKSMAMAEIKFNIKQYIDHILEN